MVKKLIVRVKTGEETDKATKPRKMCSNGAAFTGKIGIKPSIKIKETKK